MNQSELIQTAVAFTETSEYNLVGREIAMQAELAGQKMFEAPIFGFADAGDPIFESFLRPEAIGGHYWPPEKWLNGCKTVISFFLPFTKEVIESNSRDFEIPSPLWLHARIEGQGFIRLLTEHLVTTLNKAGRGSVAPLLDARFADIYQINESEDESVFSSNWSERHAAYAAGLGTFGLSKGLITEKGVAGRFGSVLTQAAYTPTPRKYTGIYDYCTNCGACIRHCPANAISFKKGKEHLRCYLFVSMTRERFSPRYGCGKCQVNTPCTSRIPDKL